MVYIIMHGIYCYAWYILYIIIYNFMMYMANSKYTTRLSYTLKLDLGERVASIGTANLIFSSVKKSTMQEVVLVTT